MNTIKPINRRITVEDLETPEWKDVVLEMHSMMKVQAEKMHKFAYCTDRRYSVIIRLHYGISVERWNPDKSRLCRAFST